jgi:hypothetical protein
MDKKSKIFFWVLGVLILASIGVTYWRIMLKKDYIIEAEADCDPATETCFVYKCNPQTEECTGNPDEDTSYYKLIRRNASKIPTCDPADENCQPLVCGEGEKDCEEILCTEQTKTPEDVCSNPVQYNLENPAEEEVGEEAGATEETQCDSESQDCSTDETVPAEGEGGGGEVDSSIPDSVK